MWERSYVREVERTEWTGRSLVIAPAGDEPLYRHVTALFAHDAVARVVDCRRHVGRAEASEVADVERRVSGPTFSPFGVAVIRLSGEQPAPEQTVQVQAGRRSPATMEGIEDRQRVDRWLEESQYLIGRIIPAYLDDRDRVKTRLESAEEENERLKGELADARREIADLRADLDFHRAERARIAETFHSMVEHLTALNGPVNEISSRLQTLQPVTGA
jgi:hypothetical protein